MEKVVVRRGDVRCEGVCLGEWRLLLSCREDCAPMVSFYEELAEGVEREFCQGAFRERAEREYGESSDPLKRFHFGTFRYVLEGKICFDSPTLCSVRLDATLSRRGNRELRFSGMDVHTWDLREGILLPPQDVLAEVGGTPMTRKERKRTKAVLLTAGGALLFDGGSLYPRK